MTKIEKKDFCCEAMVSHLFIPDLQMIFDDGDIEDKLIHYNPCFNEYGIPFPDGSSSMLIIHFCPWCGKRLPQSRRYQWCDLIEQMGFNPEDNRIPSEYRTNEWWAKGEKG